MSSVGQVVIVGAGLAGATAAKTFREEGFDGRVFLVGSEAYPPYERPPLSKDYLRGETTQVDAYVEPEQYWADHEVELLTGVTAAWIDLGNGRLELAGERSIAFDRLLLATGATPNTLTVPGSELDGVVTLRRFEDADTIRTRAGQADRILVVGGGWIASEVAASLRTLGHDVTVAVRGRRPLEGSLGPQIAQIYRSLHHDHDVTLLPETEIVALDGDGREAVRRARTTSGAWLDTELVVVAIGVTPRTDLARAAGLTVTNGIVVDGRLATSDPRVFAVGDAALVPHVDFGRSLRVEHWGTALAQGAHAARTMLGDGRPYDGLPYYFSDQYDTGMEFWGDPTLAGEMVLRGDPDARSFTAFWHNQGYVSAVLNMHVHHHDHGHEEATGHAHTDHHEGVSAHAGGHVNPAAVERLIRSTVPTGVEALQDPDIPLEALVPVSAGDAGSG